MDDITASIIVQCQTSGASKAVSKLGFSLAMLGKQAIRFGIDAVKSFSDLQEESQKFSVVFDGIGDRASAVVAQLTTGYGQSELSAKKMLASTGDLLTGFGMAKDVSLDLAEGAAKLGSDLASFSNYAGGAEGATHALTKAMLGERESLKLLGVVIREDDERYKELTKQAKTTGVTIPALGKTIKVSNDQQAKAVASLALAYEQSKNAIGDFGRSMGSIANQGRSLDNRLLDMKISIGGFIDSFLQVGSIKSEVADVVLSITQWIKQNSAEWAYHIASFLNSTRAGFELLFIVGKNAFSNIHTIVLYTWEICKQAWSDAPGFFGAVWNDVKLTADNTFEFLRTIIFGNFTYYGEVLSSFGTHWWSIFKDIADIGWRAMQSISVYFKDSIVEMFKFLGRFGESFWDLLTGKKKFSEATSDIINGFNESLQRIASSQQKVWEGFSFGDGTKQFAEEVKNALGKYAQTTAAAGIKIGADLGKNTAEFLEKNNVKMGALTNWNEGWEQAVDRYSARQKGIDSRRGSTVIAESSKGEKTPSASSPSFTANATNLLREAFKFRETAQSAVLANSLEGMRLQSRRMPSADPQKQAAERLGTLTDQGSTIIDKLDTVVRTLATGRAFATVRY